MPQLVCLLPVGTCIHHINRDQMGLTVIFSGSKSTGLQVCYEWKKWLDSWSNIRSITRSFPIDLVAAGVGCGSYPTSGFLVSKVSARGEAAHLSCLHLVPTVPSLTFSIMRIILVLKKDCFQIQEIEFWGQHGSCAMFTKSFPRSAWARVCCCGDHILYNSVLRTRWGLVLSECMWTVVIEAAAPGFILGCLKPILDCQMIFKFHFIF